MDVVKSPLRQRFWRWLNRQLAKLLIRFRVIKQEVYTPAELNELLATNLPHELVFDLPGSQGKLVLLESELSIPLGQKSLHIQLLADFTVSVVGQDIYRAHVLISGVVTPYYDPKDKAIRLKDMALNDIRLVKDDYAFISSTTDLVALFMPGPFKYLLSSTVHVTLMLLKGVITSDLFSYLSIYTSASKQKVLDFHKNEIERLVIEEIEQDDWYYELDEDDFEEQLFSELGQQVVVEQGQLVFKFHQD